MNCCSYSAPALVFCVVCVLAVFLCRYISDSAQRRSLELIKSQALHLNNAQIWFVHVHSRNEELLVKLEI
jgi:hypothetical protein